MRRTVLVLLVVAAAACGIDSSDAVEEIEPEELDALTQISPTTTTTVVPQTSAPTDTTTETQVSAPPETGTVETPESSTTMESTTTTVPTDDVELYFISGSQVVSLEFALPIPISHRDHLEGLAVGPSADDAEAGIRTAVPPGLVGGLDISGMSITVDLRGEVLNGVESPDQLHMFGQIVLTLTGQMSFDEVRFTVDDEPARVFRGDNSLSESGEAVTRGDYEELLEDGQQASPSTLAPETSTP